MAAPKPSVVTSCKLCSAGCTADVEDAATGAITPAFNYAPLIQRVTGADDGVQRHVPKGWTKVEGDWVKTIRVVDADNGGDATQILVVKKGALAALAHKAMVEVQHFFREDHLKGWRRVLEDPEASDNDRFVATQLMRNACIASGMVLPACQDTGTAIVLGVKGERVWTESDDKEELSHGIWAAYTQHHLRYSQTAPLSMFKEANTKCNLPAQFDLFTEKGAQYDFLLIAKGGGSANKSFLYQETKALLNPVALRKFIREKLRSLGTAACPPYHLALVVGGMSAEQTMKMVKLASCRYLDDLPTTGDDSGRAFRDPEWERIVMEEAHGLGIGAQFGGKYFAHQARVIRLPRHGASCPVGLGVSCSADRQILCKLTADGMFVEELVHDPAQYMPPGLAEPAAAPADAVVRVDLSQPMADIRKQLSQYPVKTRLSLSGTIVAARDMAHAKLQERLDNGEGLPAWAKERIIYYAGPAKTPEGMASGSFGPTTAGRMDSYVAPFMAAGGSFISLAKGNRSPAVTAACKEHGGFYLGSIGGPAAILAAENIKRVAVLEYAELGMEAVWEIDVVDFPAFIVVDDKGNDFFQVL